MTSDSPPPINWQIQPGPCVVCGATNYPLSMGGPGLCPSCDMGATGPAVTERLRMQLVKLQAQLSVYVTAAEGRPASELVAPSEVERLIGERAELTALNMGLHQLIDEQAGGCDVLERKLAEQAAEIKKLKDAVRAHQQPFLPYCVSCKREWSNDVRCCCDIETRDEPTRELHRGGRCLDCCPGDLHAAVAAALESVE